MTAVASFLSTEAVEQAAMLIDEACRSGRPLNSMPKELTPGTVEDAYAIQAALYRRRSDGAPAGWYVSATNPSMQRQLGLKEPFSSRWPAHRFLESGATLPVRHVFPVALEAEVTLELGRDLPPRIRPYTLQEIDSAVAAARASIEVVITCFADWFNQNSLNLIAEGGIEQYLVLGPRFSEWREIELSNLPVKVTCEGAVVSEGSTSNVMAGPLSVLHWLAIHASDRGLGLAAGQQFNTGMCASVYWANPDDGVMADFGPLGSVSLKVPPARTGDPVFREGVRVCQ